ncbi:hypothetical protein PCANC_14451 [Puccinia coronata f. sp. avenae]|uniref:OTU domain-containing protein n=1 Tax=Puccinia coronata f. sp. avenae TaxID=200324 RepID=A0A2N5USH2_9BASI|nr:hypothetical protein PCANC_14451 [Puccinia coronata f. sp. avenae]
MSFVCFQTQQLEIDEPEYEVEDKIQKLVLSLCNEDSHTICNVLQQFKQIAAGTHKAIAIQAPNIKQSTKGRPPLSKKSGVTSTKRNPSAFEIVESKLKKKNLQMKSASTIQRKKTKRVKRDSDTTSEDEELIDPSDKSDDEDEDIVNETNKEEDSPNNQKLVSPTGDGQNKEPANEAQIEDHPFFSQVLAFLQKYVTELFDPPGDRNCGFHCMAKALGYKDNGWLQVRNEMVKEIKKDILTYYPLQGGEKAELYSQDLNAQLG